MPARILSTMVEAAVGMPVAKQSGDSSIVASYGTLAKVGSEPYGWGLGTPPANRSVSVLPRTVLHMCYWVERGAFGALLVTAKVA